MRGIRLSDRVLLSGQTQKGKTTLSKFIVAGLQPVRVVVFDPKDELRFPGVTPCRTPEGLEAHLADPLIHYVPSGFERAELEDACEIVWRRLPGPYVWWVTEASEISNPSYCPTGLRLCVTQGAKDRKMTLIESQRVAEIHPVLRAQAGHVFQFVPAPIELDLKTIAGHVRREARVLEEELRSLHEEHGDFSHLWWVQDGDELRRCAPIPFTEPRPPRTPPPPAASDA